MRPRKPRTASDVGCCRNAATAGAQQTYSQAEASDYQQMETATAGIEAQLAESEAQSSSTAEAGLAQSNGTPWARLEAAHAAALASWTNTVERAYGTDVGVDAQAEGDYERSVAYIDAVFADAQAAADAADQLVSAQIDMTDAQLDRQTYLAQAAADSYACDLPRSPTQPDVPSDPYGYYFNPPTDDSFGGTPPATVSSVTVSWSADYIGWGGYYGGWYGGYYGGWYGGYYGGWYGGYYGDWYGGWCVGFPFSTAGLGIHALET